MQLATIRAARVALEQRQVKTQLYGQVLQRDFSIRHLVCRHGRDSRVDRQGIGGNHDCASDPDRSGHLVVERLNGLDAGLIIARQQDQLLAGGDGMDDEFRVAYKSIVSFKAVVYNRWGREVFRWTDPGKGWDGYIGGKLANPGPYYYIIEAEGSDKDADGKNRQYKLKGDINLLR